MAVPYRLPESFGLMVLIAGLIFGEPYLVEIFNLDWLISKIILLAAGLLITFLYLKLLLLSDKKV